MAEVADSLSDPPADRKGVFGWIFFDAAMQPWFTLVTTFVFGPYVVSALAASPAEGQAMWGYAAGFAGLTIALLSPPLGAIADAAGPRKPWIALLGLIMAVCACGLWFAEPRVPYGLTLALVLFAVGTVAAEMAGVFNNAMMPSLVPPTGSAACRLMVGRRGMWRRWFRSSLRLASWSARPTLD